jgi:hypothetical protein
VNQQVILKTITFFSYLHFEFSRNCEQGIEYPDDPSALKRVPHRHNLSIFILPTDWEENSNLDEQDKKEHLQIQLKSHQAAKNNI